MRLLAVTAALLAIGLLGAGWASGTRTELHVTVWPEGKEGPSKRWVLRCDPAGGTLPSPARACRVLASLKDPFAPVPPDAVCTQLYGGPAVALVRGTYRDRRIWTWFRRRDGCEISRWNRHRVLFPVSTAA